MNINSLPHPQLVQSLYDTYYSKDVEGDFVSSHWKDYSSRTGVKITPDGNLTQFSGYGFGDLQYGRFYHRILNTVCNVSYFIRLPDKKELSAVWKAGAANVKVLGQHFSYDCFRQSAAFALIRKHLGKEAPTVLIIGDGYGFMASLFKSFYPKSRIVLVDLGRVLLFQSVNLQRIFPAARHALFVPGKLQGADIVYCPAENVRQMQEFRYDVIVNIASMGEMPPHVIKMYFDYIRINAAENNLFYCCNREYKKMPGGEVTEFMKYPWAAEDKHLVDERCPYIQYYLAPRPPFVFRFGGGSWHRLTKMHRIKGKG